MTFGKKTLWFHQELTESGKWILQKNAGLVKQLGKATHVLLIGLQAMIQLEGTSWCVGQMDGIPCCSQQNSWKFWKFSTPQNMEYAGFVHLHMWDMEDEDHDGDSDSDGDGDDGVGGGGDVCFDQ